MMRFTDIYRRPRGACAAGRGWFLGSVLVWLCIALSGIVGDRAGAQDMCDAARKELRQESQRLNEYVSALQESYDDRDFKLAEVLKFKIGQAKKKLQDLQLMAENCPAGESKLPESGLSGAKSDDGRYADVSCIDLKKMLFPLLVSKRELERRQKSMLSKPTDEEEAKLRDVSDKLRDVRRALKTRCSRSKSSHSLLKRLQR
ncbi:MAG: hypothetical protein RDU20_12540 [Desulfomonilaceae bacterium]|nr:hypothetical protein [Desulfomonilaceae bacterium]